NRLEKNDARLAAYPTDPSFTVYDCANPHAATDRYEVPGRLLHAAGGHGAPGQRLELWPTRCGAGVGELRQGEIHLPVPKAACATAYERSIAIRWGAPCNTG